MKTLALIVLSLCAACSDSKPASSRARDAALKPPVIVDAAPIPVPDAAPPPIDPAATISDGKVHTVRDFTLTVPSGWKKDVGEYGGSFAAPGGKLTAGVRTDFAGSDVREYPADQVLTAEFERRRAAQNPNEHIQMFSVGGLMGILTVEEIAMYDEENGSWSWHTYVPGAGGWLKEESLGFSYPKGTADEHRQMISGIVNSVRIQP